MPLRAKKPAAVEKRLKFLLYGEMGVGKTMSAIQWKNAYFIDCEHGGEEDEYREQLERAKSEIFQTTEMREIAIELRELRSTKHDFRTVIIDPITVPYHDTVIEQEEIVGTDWGAHYREADKELRKLFKLLMLLDMNVIVTAHAKWEYQEVGGTTKRVGVTFDASTKLGYMFDLVLFMERHASKRVVTVRKSRIRGFPDGETFEWSYEEFMRRYGETIEKKATPAVLATSEQVAALVRLLEAVKVPDGTEASWLKKAGVDVFGDMTADQIVKCVTWLESRAKGNGK
jgi:hypothetical protein